MQNVKTPVVLSKDMPRAPSPSPSLCAKVLEKYVSFKEGQLIKPDLSSSLPSSPSSKTDTKTVQQVPKFCLKTALSALPDDPDVREKYLTKIIEFYASCGALDSLIDINPESKELIQGWRKPANAATTQDGVLYRSRVAFPMIPTALDRTQWLDTTTAGGNGATGRVCSLAQIFEGGIEQRWNRQSNEVIIKRINGRYGVQPIHQPSAGVNTTTTSFAASNPRYSVFIFVDTLALMSNPGPAGSGIPVIYNEISTSPGPIGAVNPNALFIQNGLVGSAATDVPAFYARLKSEVTFGSRFHMLYHREHTTRSQETLGVVTLATEGPTEQDQHEFDIKLDPPIHCPYADANVAGGYPYMNNIWFCMYQHDEPGIPVIQCLGTYNVKVTFRDIGESF